MNYLQWSFAPLEPPKNKEKNKMTKQDQEKSLKFFRDFLKPIGIIRSNFKTRAECPTQAHPDMAPSQLVIFDEYLDALKGLRCGEEIYIFTWLHEGDRDKLQCHPRGDITRPKTGVFATRSPDRPNPIGLHRAKILQIRENTLTIHPIEVIDNTPVIDIKPVDYSIWKEDTSPYVDPKIAKQIKDIGKRAWFKGLISGYNGNISVFFDDKITITKSGINKGMIDSGDLAVYDVKSKKFLYGEPSSEWKMHLGIYKKQSLAKAILHTHPKNIILAVERMENFLEKINLFEREIFMEKLSIVRPLLPGSEELAKEVASASSKKQIIVLKRHGLVCWGKDLKECLSLTEELEYLAEMSIK